MSKKLIAGIVVVVAVAFAVGRYTVPTKVRIEKEIVEVEKKTKETDLDKNKHKQTVVKEIVKPDGTRETTTTTVEDSNTSKNTKENSESSRNETELKEVTKTAGSLAISALAGTKLSLSDSLPPLVYGAHISKDILGPISIGVWGLTNSTGGVSIGLRF